MDEFTTYVKGMLKKLLLFTLVITAVLMIAGGSRFVLGWLVGSGLNLVYFIMLSNRSARAMKMAPEQAVAFIRAGAFLRLVTIILALIVVTQFPVIHFGACVAGILSFKIFTYVDTLFQHIIRKREGR